MALIGGSVGRVGILVAGMHRSGTSAVTRLLASLGCDLPLTLMEADSHNALGYWESTEIANLNDAILDAAGSSWDDWEAFDPELHASAAAEFLERAQIVLLSEFGDSRLFVLKDPRICRLLEFWKEAFDGIGAAPVVVLPIRNPLEVAASLRERDAFDPSVGMLVWLRNVLDAEVGSRGLRRSFTRYEEALDDWKRLADRIGSELDVAWPRGTDVADIEMDPLISASVRHHALDDAHVHDDPLVARWVKTVFEILNRWARGSAQRDDAGTLDAIRSALNDSGPNFSHAIAVGRQATQKNREYEAQVAALDHAAQSLEQAVVNRDGQIADLDEAVRERDQHIADRDRKLRSISALLSERDRKLTSISELLSERDRKLTSISELLSERDRQVADRDVEIESLNDAVAVRDERIGSLDQTIFARESQIDAILGSTSWRITRPLRDFKDALLVFRRGTVRYFSRTAYRAVGLLWRGIPLGRLRARTKGPLLRLLPRRFVDQHLGQRAGSSRRYVACGRLQLADRNFDAVNNQGDKPILFDPEYYLVANEDVRSSGADPLRHYLDHGAVEGRLPLALEPDEVDPSVEALHRIDLHGGDAFAFDAAFYRDLHRDLPRSSDRALLEHYRRHGRAESRAGSRGEFVRQLCDDPREIPLDFKASEYIALYPDLKGLAVGSSLDALRHYMCDGRWEPRLHTSRGDPSPSAHDGAPVDMPLELLSKTPPLAVLVHIYYPDLWQELAGYLANLPDNTYDLYVNLVETTFTRQLEQSIRDAFPAVNIYVNENIGRDIGGHFQLLRNIAMEDYRFFGLVHSKMSPHLAAGESLLWRRRLLTALMGTREIAVANLKSMLSDDTIGVIGSRRCRDTDLRDNTGKFMELLDMLDVGTESRDVEFVSGTMMYLRREVLQKIFETCKDLPFEKGDDTPLQFHLDAQWAHALERVIGNVVRDMHYRFEWR